MSLDEVLPLLIAVSSAFVAGALVGGRGTNYLARTSKTKERSDVLRSAGLSLLWGSDTGLGAKVRFDSGRAMPVTESLTHPLTAMLRSSGFSLLRDETRRDGDSGSRFHM